MKRCTFFVFLFLFIFLSKRSLFKKEKSKLDLRKITIVQSDCLQFWLSRCVSFLVLYIFFPFVYRNWLTGETRSLRLNLSSRKTTICTSICCLIFLRSHYIFIKFDAGERHLSLSGSFQGLHAIKSSLTVSIRSLLICIRILFSWIVRRPSTLNENKLRLTAIQWRCHLHCGARNAEIPILFTCSWMFDNINWNSKRIFLFHSFASGHLFISKIDKRKLRKCEKCLRLKHSLSDY